MQPDYSNFVKERFKRFPTWQESLLHAAVGFVGEMLELKDCVGRENQLEELGDALFYLEAMEQVLEEQEGDRYRPLPNVGEINPIVHIDVLLTCGGVFLDHAKKMWAYGKVYEKEALTDFVFDVAEARSHLSELARMLGYVDDAMMLANKTKLLKRFPTGYSDKDAQERKDKEQGE